MIKIKPAAVGLWASMVFLVACAAAMATEVVAIVSHQWVFLATDSLMSNVDGSSPHFGCKMRQTGSVYWTMTGLYGPTVPDLFNEASKRSTDLGGILDEFARLIAPALQANLPLVKEQNPDLYRGMTQGTDPSALNILAVQIRNSHLIVLYKVFKVVDLRVIPQPSSSCTAGPQDSSACYIMAPELDFSAANAGTNDPVVIIDRLMDQGRVKEPHQIGGPTSILLLTPDGPQWIRKGLCQDIRSGPSDLPARIPDFPSPR